jgi:hypothetical protein
MVVNIAIVKKYRESLTGNPHFATVRIGMRRRPVADAFPLG